MKIEIVDLEKKYGDFLALNKLNLTLNDGIYGLLGPNGAGKSTLIGILTDNLKRTGGSVLCDGTDIAGLQEKYRARLGYMPQSESCYNSFRAQEFLEYMAVMKGIRRKDGSFAAEIERVLREVNLYERRRERIGNFSGGMKRRILLAQAMLGEPEIMILDEPTAGLDPKERVALRNSIAKNSKGKIVLVATHIVSDIESIANYIILLDKGEVMAYDTPERLMEIFTEEKDRNLENLYMHYFVK